MICIELHDVKNKARIGILWNEWDARECEKYAWWLDPRRCDPSAVKEETCKDARTPDVSRPRSWEDGRCKP